MLYRQGYALTPPGKHYYRSVHTVILRFILDPELLYGLCQILGIYQL